MAKFLIMNEIDEVYQADCLTEDDYISQQHGVLWIFDITDPEHPTQIRGDENCEIPKWEF